MREDAQSEEEIAGRVIGNPKGRGRKTGGMEKDKRRKCRFKFLNLKVEVEK